MSDRLRKQIAVECEQLHRLLEVHRPLLTKCRSAAPSDIELSALAAMLHSFYTGIENVLKRICAKSGDDLPRGEFWHRQLLDAMACAGKTRSPVITADLRDRLAEYLQFRHVFRHAYSFELRWEKMRPMVLDCEETLASVEAQLESFLSRL